MPFFKDMWEDSEETALTVGIPTIKEFWNTTPKQFNKYVRAYQRRLTDIFKLTDINNHQLGLYVRTAYADVWSDKNKYPKKPQMIDLDIFQLEEKEPSKRKLSEQEVQEFLEKRRKTDRKNK